MRGRRCDTNTSIILNCLLRHVASAEVGEKVITDDSVDCLEAFEVRCLLVLDGDSSGDPWERRNDWGGGGSDGGHDREAVGKGETMVTGVLWRSSWDELNKREIDSDEWRYNAKEQSAHYCIDAGKLC
jgi:hypothetical protein